MSNSPIPLKVVAVNEPRLELNNERVWVVQKGSQDVSYYGFPISGPSSNSFNFITNPPSTSTILDRMVFLQTDVNIQFVANQAIYPANENLLQPGRDAFRCAPISSVTKTLTAVINGFPVNIELSDVIHPLMRYHSDHKKLRGFLSMMADMDDQYQSYQDADGANNNPLGGFVDNSNMGVLGRGAYPFTVVSNTHAGAEITARLYEPVILPPFIFDSVENEAGGLSNLSSLTFNWVLDNLPRMWSHSDINNSTPDISTISSMNISFSNQIMWLCFLTPSLNVEIPREIIYPYFNVQRFTTSKSGIQPLAPNATTILKSNVIQVDSCPRKIYILAREQSIDITDSVSHMVNKPDVFAQITNINLTFGNKQGVLSQANNVQLYNFSVQNGYSRPYINFNGFSQQLSALGNTKIIGTEGSVVCIAPGVNLGLDTGISEGALGQFNLQANVTVVNPNQYRSINYDLVLILIFDGTLVISPGSALASIGVASKEEILNSPIDPNISWNELQKLYGGDFYSTFKDLASKAHKFIKDNRLISQGLSGLSYLHPAFSPASKVARLVGYGQNQRRRKRRGGVLYGGGSEEYDDEEIYGGEELPRKQLGNDILKRLGH